MNCLCPQNLENSKIFDILQKFPPNSREFLITILQAIQERYEYISTESMIDVAKYVGIPVSKVYGVATFYNQFKLNAPGKYKISICRGTACHVNGSDLILKAFEAELGIKAGQTTKDKMFSIDTVACIGSCSIAPVITINGNFYGRVKAKNVAKILSEITKKGE